MQQAKHMSFRSKSFLTVHILHASDTIRAYFKQLREETSQRIVARIFDAEGVKSKW
jgi:hypothetical protein